MLARDGDWDMAGVVRVSAGADPIIEDANVLPGIPVAADASARAFSELLADPSVLRVGLRRRLAGEPAAWVVATAPSAVAAEAPPPPAELSDLIYVQTEADGSGQELARSR